MNPKTYSETAPYWGYTLDELEERKEEEDSDNERTEMHLRTQ